MEPLLGVLIGAVLGGLIHEFAGAVVGALLGYLVLRVMRQEKQIELLGERLKALHVLFEEGHYGERIRALQQRLDRLDATSPTQVGSQIDQSASFESAPAFDETVDSVVPEVAPKVLTMPEMVEHAPTAITSDESPVTPPVAEVERPRWQTRLLSGNPLAKIGAILLFFGFASAFKLAVEHGWFPLPLRVMLAASVAITMVAFGWQQRTERPRFADALQGSGFAILYLIIFFMLSRWGWISAGPAFAAFVVLAGACVTLALLQSTQVLALFGSAGGFLAPILASTGQDNHVLLFSFYLLLGIALVAAAAGRGWRVLAIAGMVFTFVIGLSWAWRRYEPTDYASTQAFLLAFFVLYGAWPLWVTRRFTLQASDATLTFGVPVLFLALQYSLVQPWRYGFAISAALAGGGYLLLWLGMRSRQDWLPTAFLGLAIGMLTGAIPFALDVAPSAGLWAIEGAAGLAVALKYRSRLGKLAGLGLQGLAGFYLLTELGFMTATLPVMNTPCLSAGLIALAGMASAWLLARFACQAKDQTRWMHVMLGWSLLWWFATGWREIDLFIVDQKNALVAALVHWAVTVLVLEAAGVVLRWQDARRVTGWLNLLLLGGLIQAWGIWGHALVGMAGWAWLLALTVSWLLRWRQDALAGIASTFMHPLLFGLTLAILASEAVWRVQEMLALSRHGQYLFALPVFALALLFCQRWPRWPVTSWPQLYAVTIALPIACLTLLGSVWVSLTVAGNIASTTYFPLFSVFDGVQLLALYSVYRWNRSKVVQWGHHLVWGCGFVWLSMLPARVATAWFGARFGVISLLNVPEAATGLALVWTALALLLMWQAQRYASRARWFAGFSLLCAVGAKLLLIDLRSVGTIAWTISLIGVALLVLAASYVAPAPPKDDNRPETGPDTPNA